MDESRSRRPTRPSPALQRSAGTSARALSTNTGPLATSQWLVERGLAIGAPARWNVEITFEGPDHDTRLQVDIYSDEWGVKLRHQGRESWIRITDVAFVHGRDDFGLLRRMPRLSSIGGLIAAVERELGVCFDRTRVHIQTNLHDDSAVRAWAANL